MADAKKSKADPYAAYGGSVATDDPYASYNDPAAQMRTDSVSRNAGSTQFEKDRDPNNQPGFFHSAGSELLNLGSGIAHMVDSGSRIMHGDITPAVEMGRQAVEDDQRRQDMGRSGAYRTIAGVGGLVGVNARGMEDAADVGNASGVMGTAVADAVPAIATAALAKPLGKFIGAESDPNVVYHRYLDPVADIPEQMPPMNPRVARAMSTKAEWMHPELNETVKGKRVLSGDSTLGKLDSARQVANESSASAKGESGGIPSQSSQGYQSVADNIRDTVYPRIESLHNMEPGSLSSLKRIQGKMIEAGPTPKIGTDPLKWPSDVYNLGVRNLITKPYYGLRTKMIDMNLPPPTEITPRSSLPPSAAPMVKSIQPASVELGGEQDIPEREAPPVEPAMQGYEPVEPALNVPKGTISDSPPQPIIETDPRIARIAPRTRVRPFVPSDFYY